MAKIFHLRNYMMISFPIERLRRVCGLSKYEIFLKKFNLNVQLHQIYDALKSLEIREPQSFQQGDVINYKSVQETKLKPYLTQIDNTGKKDRKWLWLYYHTQDQSPFVNFNFDT